MHAQLNAAFRTLGNAKQFNAVAHVFRVTDVGRRQFCDAFNCHGIKVNGVPKASALKSVIL